MVEDEIGKTEEIQETEKTEEEEENLLTGAEARESLASLGLSPEEGQAVPDYDGTIKIFKEGDIVKGTVVKVDKEEVLLDIGYKSEGVIPARELSIRYDIKPADVVNEGDELEALVLQKEDKEGRLILSKKRAQYERAWGNIERLKEEDGMVEGEVIEVVKGGLILDIGLRGFLPASLVDMRRVKDLNQFIGRKLEAKIIELDKNRNNVVLSRRAYLETQKSTERKDFLENLEKGSKHKGTVSSIVNFGSFVDLGGVDGLIHISELSWSHVDHPSEVLAVGQEVEVEILDVDLERERVSLSLKKAQEDPWETLAKDKPAGSTVHGKVTKLVPFGAFVEIASGVEGLVHISELAWEHIEFPEEIVSVGEEVDAKIIDIDLDRRRISLSLKQLSGPGEAEYHELGEEQRLEPELVEAEEFEEKITESTESDAAEYVVREEIASEAAGIAAEVEEVAAATLEASHIEPAVAPEAADATAEQSPQADAKETELNADTKAEAPEAQRGDAEHPQQADANNIELNADTKADAPEAQQANAKDAELNADAKAETADIKAEAPEPQRADAKQAELDADIKAEAPEPQRADADRS